MEEDAFFSSEAAAPISSTSTEDERLEIAQQSTDNARSIDEGMTLPAHDTESSTNPTTSASVSNDTGDHSDVDRADGGSNSSLDDQTNASSCCTGPCAPAFSETEPDNLRQSLIQTKNEPPAGAYQSTGASALSEFPPVRIHPFDLPSPLQVGDIRKTYSNESTALSTTVSSQIDDLTLESKSERSTRSEAAVEKEALGNQDYEIHKILSEMYPSIPGTNCYPSARYSRLALERNNLKESGSELDLECKSDMDDSKGGKYGCPSSGLLIDEDTDGVDDALRPPELMRQDAASGLVWSVSQPGAFRQGGTEDLEEEHDDWMMATRVSETPTTVDDSQIIVHAAAVVDDRADQRVGAGTLQAQSSSIVFMGGEVEACEIRPDTQTSPAQYRQYRQPKHSRRVYAAFVCAVFIAVTLAVLVTVQIVESSSHESKHPSVNWPSPTPFSTSSPTSSNELLSRSSANNDSKFPKANSIFSSMEDFVWKRMGSGLDGKFANETMGYSVSISEIGWVLAIGSPWANDASQTGSVSVYHLEANEEWTLVGNPISGISDGERFGWSLDISDSGDIFAASAPAVGSGRVSIYQFDAVHHVWGKLGNDLVGEHDGQNFGFSVSLSGTGNIVATGNPGSGNDTGQVSVYQYSGSAWELMGSQIQGMYGGQRFGGSVSLSLDGQTLAVGTIEHRCRKRIPHVRVYRWNNAGWQLMGKPMNGTSALDQCAVSVAISADGRTVAAGAYLSSHDGNVTGNVLVFRWVIDHWQQLGSTIVGESEHGNFGISVAMSLDGNLLAVGANLAGKNGAGRVRLFRFNQTVREWQRHGPSIDGKGFDEFGKSVAMSPGGRVVASGAYMHSESGLQRSGQVRVYTSF